MDISDDSNHKLTRLTSVSNLREPGADSNYLNWEFKMELALENLGLSSVLSPSLLKDHHATWTKDNTKA